MPERIEGLTMRRVVVDLPDRLPPRFSLIDAPDGERAWRDVVDLAKDLRPVGPTDAAPPVRSLASKLLASFDAACAASEEPMYVGGPPANLFRGVKREAVRGFFGAFDDKVRTDKRFAKNMARMCRGYDVPAVESKWTNNRLIAMLAARGLTLEVVDLPPGALAKAAEKISKVKFYPAEFGTGKVLLGAWNRGILTWKRGKNGVSIKVTNAFEPNTYRECPLCMGDGPYEVLEFVVELHEGVCRLNVLERDANGGTRHSKAAIAQTLDGAAGKEIVDGQFFFHDESGRWFGRTALAGPMLTSHGRHVPRDHILQKEQKRGDGTTVITHWWDCFGVGGANYALITPEGEVIGLDDRFASEVAITDAFKAQYPNHRLVQIPRRAGRNL